MEGSPYSYQSSCQTIAALPAPVEAPAAEPAQAPVYNFVDQPVIFFNEPPGTPRNPVDPPSSATAQAMASVMVVVAIALVALVL